MSAARWVGMLVGLVALTASACSSSEQGSGPPTSLERPSFVQLGELDVPADGEPVPLADSGLRYYRRDVEIFDDPASSGHDGISVSAREVLACRADAWNMGAQIFTVDQIAMGIDRGDPTLVERGAVGVDWGVEVPLNDAGEHLLRRECDGTTVPTSGGTHTGLQWLEALGRAVHLLRATGDPVHEERIDRYLARIDEYAELVTRPENERYWREHWLVDEDGNIFTHKTYMRAAALGLAASLTEDREAAARWAEEAAAVAREGMVAQRADGVNPERGGYDVSYQMYGTWLAQLYYSTLEPGPLKTELGAAIDRSVDWMWGRVDPATGRVDIGDSTRTCTELDGNATYESADTVRVFLLWGAVRDRRDLLERAVAIDRGNRPATPCPPG